MKIYYFILLAFCSLTNYAVAQSKQVRVNFEFFFNKNELQLTDTPQVLRSSDQLQIEVLKFYISNIKFMNRGKLVYEEKNCTHLIDGSANGKSKINVSIPDRTQYDEMRFNFGVDSLMNVSGAMGGDLDPTKGMYWTWQSGYINFKMEGKSILSAGTNREFQLHIGGYMHPYNAVQEVNLTVESKPELFIDLDMAEIINSIDLKTQHHIMSPSYDAVRLAEVIAKSFKVISE